MATREKIKLTSYNELLGINNEMISEIDMNKLHQFKDHPFSVVDNEKMLELAKSIEKNGILSPILVRPLEDGEYEIISGHRRRRASEIVGIAKIPAIIKDISHEEAIPLMVDANFQREDTLPSEKARAYKMKMDALTHQGKCADSKVTSAKQIGQMAGISDRQVQRYIRLTELIPELSKMVDDKKITFMFGVEISFLKEEYQQLVYKNISKGKKVSKDKIKMVKENQDNLSVEEAEQLLFEEKENTKKKICTLTLKENKLSEFFDSTYTKKEMEKVIYSLLKEWKKGKD